MTYSTLLKEPSSGGGGSLAGYLCIGGALSGLTSPSTGCGGSGGLGCDRDESIVAGCLGGGLAHRISLLRGLFDGRAEHGPDRSIPTGKLVEARERIFSIAVDRRELGRGSRLTLQIHME